MKRTVCFLLSLIIIISVFSIPASAVNYKVSYETPSNSGEAETKWVQKYGTSYLDAPSVPAVAGDYLMIMSKTSLLKVDRNTGNTVATATMVDNPGFTYVPVCVSDGVAYCPLDNATIQAFDIKTMKSLWVYRDSLGGQSLTPIVEENGKIYTGFWNDEDKYANFVCISTRDEDSKNELEEKKSDWTFKSLGGFYRTECKIVGDYLYVGSDDGTVYSDKASKVYALNKATGKQTDMVDTLGDIRSGISEDSGNIFFVSKAGYLYSVGISNGKFNKSSLKRLALGGSSTSTPLIYGGRIYVGVQGAKISSGFIKVIDEKNLTVIYSAETNGYPQSNFLLSNYYEKSTGKVCVYFTCNCPLGSLSVLIDSANQTQAELHEIYAPDSSHSGYCISPVVADESSTLYYKNDSGSIFAIVKKQPSQPSQPAKKSLFRRIIEWIVSVFQKIKGLFTR